MCSTCVNFEAPTACKIVAGSISPNGWCIVYAPKEDKGRQPAPDWSRRGQLYLEGNGSGLGDSVRR